MAIDGDGPRPDPLLVAIGGWQQLVGSLPRRSNEIYVPAGLMIRSESSRSVWSTMATRGSRAPIVYLGLIGLVQLLLAPHDEGRYDGRPEWRGMQPRGAGSLTELFGFWGPRGHAGLTTALRTLMSVGLLRLPRRGSKGFGVWHRFDLLNPDGKPFVIPVPTTRRPRGYDKPIFIGVPRGFWEHGWLLTLTTKEIETLLALLYERERQPNRKEGAGWFVSVEQRQLLCLDAKTYGRSHLSLVNRGILTPVDAVNYWESRNKRGLGPQRDRPHEFQINFEIFDSPPPL
jgi:hypothetical protein